MAEKIIDAEGDVWAVEGDKLWVNDDISFKYVQLTAGQLGSLFVRFNWLNC